jgi:metallo-beta-lactamase family protein
MVLIVGFQAQHTLGRRLVERRSRVRIFGVERDRRADVVVVNGLSAHADRDDLLRYAGSVHARRTCLVHGEPEQQEPLRQTLGATLEVVVPARGDRIEID